MPEHIIKRVRGFTPDLYLSVSFQTMIKFSVKRGSKIKCVLKNILDDQGNVKNSLNKKSSNSRDLIQENIKNPIWDGGIN